jgi:glycosyltransferase involved in cell wall biosynthesis
MASDRPVARAPSPRYIVIDASPAVHRKAGLGRYADELIAALAADPRHAGEYAVFYHDAARAQPGPAIQALPRIATPLTPYPWRLRALLAHLADASQDRLLGDPPPAIFHATEHLLPRLKRTRTVFTLHDLIFRFFPQHHLPKNWIYLQVAMPLFLRRAGAVICVSEQTRRDAQRIYRVPERKLRVIHEGVHPRFRRVADPARLRDVRERLRLPERFVLAVGTVEPRKNLATLLRAFAEVRRRVGPAGDELRLVIAGRQGWLSDATYRAVDDNRLTGLARFTGYVEDDDLPSLYSLAEAFAFPSVYEGFGLPPLEAMACGAPVVCSNASSLVEVTGDAAILAPPLDVGSWADALERVLGDAALRADLAARGPRQAARFTWQVAAQATREVYDALLL